MLYGWRCFLPRQKPTYETTLLTASSSPPYRVSAEQQEKFPVLASVQRSVVSASCYLLPLVVFQLYLRVHAWKT